MQDQITTGTFDRQVPSEDETPFASRARELEAMAEALADGIKAFHADLSASGSEPARRAGFRCGDAAGQARSVAEDLRETADDLTRVAEASKPGTCSIPWGICPVHGNTLMASGGQTWCTTPGCGRRWDFDRMGLPCAEAAAFTLTDGEGDSAPVCAGHASDARRNLQGARLRALRSTSQRRTGVRR